MKHLLKLEEAAMTAFGFFLLHSQSLEFPVWAWILWFLSPDISIACYTVNSKAGAYCYNFFHHKGVALALYGSGLFIHNDWLIFIGAIMFTHSSFDRILGYGLKYPDNFKHTHLGTL